jgi:glycosyltransferase involved in cell wall biosynthesis
MANYDLSILIPARNEMFLAKTIENILENIQGDTEIIAVMDGYWADPLIPQHERVTIVHNPQAIGQRASTNVAAKLSTAKYVMKCDAHCSFDGGFDIKMIAEMHDDWTMVPLMKNLHAFDWVCPGGHRRYQGPSGPCLECGKETTRDILWQAKPSPNSVSYCFDSTPHFQYFGDYAKRPEGKGDITETMSLQGSCWMLTRDKYWELGVCDESFGIWGSQGIEVAVKTWLSGGSVIVNKKTWYAHMFRTQGGDFGFPYPISGSDQEKAKSTARNLFFNDNWDKQVRPLSWLVERFWPVKGWTEEDLASLKKNTFRFSDDTAAVSQPESEPDEAMSDKGIIYSSNPNTIRPSEPKENESYKERPRKGIIFYTDNQLKIKIAHAVQKQLAKIGQDKLIPIVSSSLKQMAFGGKNISFPHLKRGYLTMFKQIIEALETSSADIVFFCEHDVLYHPSHFDFTPPDKNTFYYNQNVWFLRAQDGHALHFDVNQLSGLCVYRETAIAHFKERYNMTEEAFNKLDPTEFNRFIRNMGFEPMTHGRVKWQNQFALGTWKSEYPNVDIKHGINATGQRWNKDQYRNQQLLINWVESDSEIPGWGNTADLVKKLN